MRGRPASASISARIATRLVEVRVEVLLQQVEHLDEHGIAERVVDLVAGLAADDHLFGAQHARCWERLACSTCEQREQGAGTQLAIAQGLDDGDAGGVGEGLEDLGLEAAEELDRHSC